MSSKELDDLARMMKELGITQEDVMKAAGSPAALERLLKPVEARVAKRQGSKPSSTTSDMEEELKQAKARFDAERNMPPTPFVAKPREWLLIAMQAEREEVLEREKGPHMNMKRTIIGTEAHSSTTPLEQLERGRL